MRKIFTTKISLQSHNPTFSYPIIRLPRDLKELAGQIVSVYETEIEGIYGFFVAPHLANLAKSSKFVNNETQANSRPKCGLNASKTQKEPWARPDLNRRPPPCQGDVITS